MLFQEVSLSPVEDSQAELLWRVQMIIWMILLHIQDRATRRLKPLIDLVLMQWGVYQGFSSQKILIIILNIHRQHIEDFGNKTDHSFVPRSLLILQLKYSWVLVLVENKKPSLTRKRLQNCPIFCSASGHSRVVSHRVHCKAGGLEKDISFMPEEQVHVKYQQK